MDVYPIKSSKPNGFERDFNIPCPRCNVRMRRSGVLGDDVIHLLNRETGVFHSQIKVFGNTVYRCKDCQIIMVVLVDSSFVSGYVQD